MSTTDPITPPSMPSTSVPSMTLNQPLATPMVGLQQRQLGKVRNPFVVWLLGLVTLGIYTMYWYYQVNSEVREYDHNIQVQPGVSVLAITLGGILFVPPIVSLVKTGGRIAMAQQSAGLASRCSGVVGLLLTFLGGFGVVYYQAELNKIWNR